MGATRSGAKAVRRQSRIAAFLACLVAVIAACGTSTLSTSPASSTVPAAATPTPTPNQTPTPTPTASPTAPPTTFLIAVATGREDHRLAVTDQDLEAQAVAGKLIVPCEVGAVTFGGVALPLSASTTCLPAASIAEALATRPGVLALLPPGLVSPEVKVLPIGGADLFGAPTHRSRGYPLLAALRTTAAAPDWIAYDQSQVRTLLSTGDTCPDRGVSHQTLVLKKGWDWAFDGGTARYTGFHYGVWGWSVPNAVSTSGGVSMASFLADHDVAVNDFECGTIADFSQHDKGLFFTIDPAFPSFLAKRAGVDAVTIGSNHMDDLGTPGIRQTIAALDAAGIEHTGAGMNLEGALAAAVVDVRGVRFAFVGWDDGGNATPTSAGTAPMSRDAVCSSLAAARAEADIVIAMPQWGFPEYHATMTERQATQRTMLYACGADDILGSGTHVASWVSIDEGSRGPRVALGSHGNFLFDQSWARWTMEGVVPELTFYGTRLVQFRLHPYTIVDGGQPNLIDPLTDGSKVENQVWHPAPFKCCRP